MNATDLKRKYGYYPIGQQLKKIQASDPESSAVFGVSVSVSDTRIVVGASGKSTWTGAAYIFDINGNQLAKIQAFDPPGTIEAAQYDYFGYSVAVSDTRIVAGAFSEDTTATNAGSAYIFDINGNEIAKIQAFDPPGTSDAQLGGNFGKTVAVSNTRIIVSAWDDMSGDAGSAYIFDIDGNEIAKIQSSDTQTSTTFGASVAVSDTLILVGAYYENSATGVVYMFDIDGNQLATIQANDPDSGIIFGRSVAVSDTRIVVGAPGKSSYAGAAYIFDINGNQLAMIQADDAETYDQFGRSVAASDTRIVVGAYQEDTTASNAGSAYIFDINGNQLAKIQASDAESDDSFGSAVAVSNNRIVVSAQAEDTTATNAGAAYIFTPGFSPFGDLCAYYDLGDPTVLDTNFSWSNYTVARPIIDSIDGEIVAGVATTLTLSLTNVADTISVQFLQNGTLLTTVNEVAVTDGSATVTVPPEVYNLPFDTEISIRILNHLSTVSNTVSKPVTGPTGGTITTSGSYRIHTFTSSGTFTLPDGLTLNNVEYLVVAGGGGGGGYNSWAYIGTYYGGGGGAGGYRSSVVGELSGENSNPEPALTLTSGSYEVVVGAGGAGGSLSDYRDPGSKGADSVFHTITSLGGGAAASDGESGNGGSGGGGRPGWTGGSGTSGQGFSGGGGSSSGGTSFLGGGGGGAGGSGSLQNGGAGLSSSITGESVTRAVGGRSELVEIGGGDNTGNGGYTTTSGGSGIVIIRYAN